MFTSHMFSLDISKWPLYIKAVPTPSWFSPVFRLSLPLFLIVCSTDTLIDWGFLISRVSETDIYLICSWEETEYISSQAAAAIYSMFIWPEEKSMITCLCKQKTYTDSIFIHEYVLPNKLLTRPHRSDTYNHGQAAELSAFTSFD